jgi:ATP-binding cassette, subfamily A (ABC1), member 3
MVGGRLRCLGPAQRLKSRFGLGYQLEIAVQLPPPGDVEGLTTLLQTVISEGRITLPEVPQALEAIQKPEWAERIAPQGSGADLWQACTASGSVGLREFAAWCRLERRLDAVLAFVEKRYPGSELRERQGTKLRFEVPSKGHSLAGLFGAIEDVRGELFIEDYSVSQTSLEQIFNGFAQQQEEETGPAAGIVSGQQRKPSAGVAAAAAAVVGDRGDA